MATLFITTILSCSEIVMIANRLVNVKLLSPQQKTEILLELKQVVPSCPLVIKSNVRK
jgi:hypothetical protein